MYPTSHGLASALSEVEKLSKRMFANWSAKRSARSEDAIALWVSADFSMDFDDESEEERENVISKYFIKKKMKIVYNMCTTDVRLSDGFMSVLLWHFFSGVSSQ